MSERESKTRSRALRSYVFATFKTHSPTELVAFLPILVARMHYEKTPKVTIREVVQQFLDYLEIKGVPLTSELVHLKNTIPEGVSCLIPEIDTPDNIAPNYEAPEEDGDGVVDLEAPLLYETQSPLISSLVPLLDACWEKSVASRFPKFLWKKFTFEGKTYYAIASWKLQGEGVGWNLAAAYSGGIVYSGQSTLLVRHEDRPVHLSKDFEGFALDIPSTMTKSKYAGKAVPVSGTLFIWALQWQPGVEVRCWLNESLGGKHSPTGDLIRQSLIMPHFLSS